MSTSNRRFPINERYKFNELILIAFYDNSFLCRYANISRSGIAVWLTSWLNVKRHILRNEGAGFVVGTDQAKAPFFKLLSTTPETLYHQLSG